jgi:4'-phosphopantetheinyl transferase
VLEATFGSSLRQVPLPRDRHGRPHLPDAIAGNFSLAHAEPWALIGVTRAHRIGVDIETARAIKMDGRRRAIIEAAASSISVSPLPDEPDARFLQAWTRLEALAKADGCGIGHLLTQLGAVGGSNGKADAAAHLASQHSLALYPLDISPGVYAAAACTGIAPSVLNLPETPEGLTALLAATSA